MCLAILWLAGVALFILNLDTIGGLVESIALIKHIVPIPGACAVQDTMIYCKAR